MGAGKRREMKRIQHLFASQKDAVSVSSCLFPFRLVPLVVPLVQAAFSG
jgi:hypothetical protein